MPIATLTAGATGKVFNGGARITPTLLATKLVYQDCTFDGLEQSLRACEVVQPALRKIPVEFWGCRFLRADKGLLGSYLSAHECTFEEMANDGVVANGPGGEVIGCTFSRLGNIVLAKKFAALKGQPYFPPHADGVQTHGYRTWRIATNVFDMAEIPGYDTNSCVIVEALKGDGKGTKINGNIGRGGNYCIYAIDWETALGTQRRLAGQYVEIRYNTLSAFTFGPINAPPVPAGNISGNTP